MITAYFAKRYWVLREEQVIPHLLRAGYIDSWHEVHRRRLPKPPSAHADAEVPTTTTPTAAAEPAPPTTASTSPTPTPAQTTFLEAVRTVGLSCGGRWAVGDLWRSVGWLMGSWAGGRRC
jgi:hypothetical protein